MRYYHMLIQQNFTGIVREYITTQQDKAPSGWKCIAICGYHDKKREVQKPCIGCVYYSACGSTTRTQPCDGRKTKRELRREREE